MFGLRDYLYAGLIAVILVFTTVDHFRAYEKGKAACEAAHTVAEMNNAKEVQKSLAKQTVDAVKETDQATKVIAPIVESKKREVEKIRVITIEVPRPESCNLSPDELRDLNKAISASSSH